MLGSFSVVSTPISASKYLVRILQHFRDLQNVHSFALLKSQKSSILSSHLFMICTANSIQFVCHIKFIVCRRDFDMEKRVMSALHRTCIVRGCLIFDPSEGIEAYRRGEEACRRSGGLASRGPRVLAGKQKHVAIWFRKGHMLKRSSPSEIEYQIVQNSDM